jgi:hypothetical protein
MAQGIHFQTRRGTLVNLVSYPEEPPAKRGAYAKRYLQEFPEIRLRRDTTASYNCYGMVFSCRRGWVELGDVVTILPDDGYRKVMVQEQPVVGDVVVYRDSLIVEHVGTIVDVHQLGGMSVPMVLSKWGPGPEFIHAVTRSPFGIDFEYWTDRP